MVTGVVILALVACLIGSVVISRGLRLTEYTSRRSREPLIRVIFTTLSTLIGGWMFFGLNAVGYEAGVVGYIIGIGYCGGLILLAKFTPKLKEAAIQHNCDTIDDLIGARYGPLAQRITSCINMLIFLGILAAQFIAMSAFLQIFTELQSAWSFYVAFAVVVAYTAFSGFKGVLFTDSWQFLVLTASALIVFILLTLNVDWEAVQALDPKYFRGTGYGIGFIVGALVFFPLTLFVRSDLWQRISCAADAKVAQRAFYLAAPLVLVYYVLFTTIGMYARATVGEGIRADSSGLIMFLHIMRGGTFTAGISKIFLSVLALGVFAALLSTADSYLSVVATSVSKAVCRNDWARFEETEIAQAKRSPLEKRLLFTTRLITIILGILSLVMAKLIPDIVDLIVAGMSALMVMLPAVLMTVFKGHRRADAAIASICAGFGLFVPLLFTLVNPKMAFLPATLLSFIVYFTVVIFVKHQPKGRETPTEWTK